MEESITLMEDCSSRIEDPIYQILKDIEQTSFFGVFFCCIKGAYHDTF